MLETQKYLLTHTLNDLQREHGVYARFSDNRRKFSLNYDMIEFRPGDEIAEECRGLILVPAQPVSDNVVGQTTVVAHPFNKFYNNTEGHAAKINWSTAKVEEKLDGTLCILYHDGTEWCVATRSVPDANVPIDGRPDLTFHSLFEISVRETFNLSFSEFVAKIEDTFWRTAKHSTFCFELTSLYNRVFCVYSTPRLTLLGIRNNKTHNELNIDSIFEEIQQVSNLNIPRPKSWNLRSAQDVQDFVNSLNPCEFEGAVVVDHKFNRVKIKNVNWIIGNSLCTKISTSKRNLVRCVLNGTIDDVAGILPRDVFDELLQTKFKLEKFFNDINEKTSTFIKIANGDRKTFAKLIMSSVKWTPPCFQMFEHKIQNVQTYIENLIKTNKLSDTIVDNLIQIIDKMEVT